MRSHRAKRGLIIPLLIIIVAVILIVSLGDSGSDTTYSATNFGPHGVSLLYDTLQHIGHPVRTSRTPIDEYTPFNDIYIVIRTNLGNPHIHRNAVYAILDWVQAGGRLIYLEDNTTRAGTVMDNVLQYQLPYFSLGGYFRHYRVGMGEIVTGRAQDVANERLMYEPLAGEIIHSTLIRWGGAEHIVFAQYYNYHIQATDAEKTFFETLPLIIQLVIFQLIIATFTTVCYVGRRFGKPIPMYEEIEREENEFVRAQARLYWKTRKNKGD